jgi:hypothetical protein
MFSKKEMSLGEYVTNDALAESLFWGIPKFYLTEIIA